MQELKSPLKKKLKSTLKKHLKDNISDIFIIGSSIKNKLEPNDVDLIVLFLRKEMKKVQESLFDIREDLDFIKEAHIEPLFVDDLLSQSIFKTIIQEGFSIKKGKKVSDLMSLFSFSIFSYGLGNLSKVDKVRFAQALYGRKKQGLLFQEKGQQLGQGSFMVPVAKEEIFKEFFKQWKVNYSKRNALVSD